jgi:RNA polymerase sigma-70 factor, ECF subfamily
LTMTKAAPREKAELGDSDGALVRRIGRRDEAALRQIVDEHGARVLSVAVRTLKDQARAEEVTQDTFLALWTDPDAFHPDKGSLRSFLVGIAHHKSVDAIRRQAARDRAIGRLAEADRSAQRETATWRHDVAFDLTLALKSLSPKLRETMFWAFFMGLTYREVAVQLDIPEGTAKSRIRDALQHLRAELSTQAQDGLAIAEVSPSS